MSHTNNAIMYELAKTDDDDSEFTIDNHNGTIFLTSKLDYEKASQHFSYLVKAIDQSEYPLTSTAEVGTLLI